MEIKNKQNIVLKTLSVDNLQGANLIATCLDPENIPSQPEQFKDGINNNLLFSAVINIEAVSKANSRIAIWKRRQFIKSIKAHRFCKEFARQLKYEGDPITCDVVFYGILYYATLRPDLDESLVLDQLQNCGVIKNDRQVKEKHVYHAIDRENPRINIKLYRLL